MTQFTETYTGFTPFGQIKETVIYPDGVPNVYNLTADANGNATSSYTLMSQVGTYNSSALDVASGLKSNTITFTTTGPDTVKPNITGFSVNQTSISPGGTFTFSYTISDSGGSGLNRAELFRAPDSGGHADTSQWAGIKSSSHSGNGSVSGTFTDSLSTPGTYWYGLHAIDNAGNTAFEPDPPGPIRVTVSTACTTPSITTHPSDQSITGGQQATLSVTAAGSGPLSYQWYQGSSGNTSNPVSGATSSSLAVQPSATTSYWVRVSNSCGIANSNAATVLVNSTALPDLTISAVVAGSYASGQTNVQIPVTVSRSGGSLPTTSPYVLARLYWSSSQTFSASAMQLWQSNNTGPDFPVSVLNSSGSRGVTATVSLPAVSASGTYYILAYVDPPTETFPGGAFSESNESNNVVAYQVSVAVPNGPFVTVSPSSGPQQTTRFITSGTGFTPNGQVRRFLVFPNNVTQEIAGTIANSSGQFSLSFTTDCSSSVGTYGEYFIDVATGGQSNTAQETVTASAGCNAPTISISPQTGPQFTTTFNTSGGGFTPNGAVRRLIVFPDGVTREATGTTADGQGQVSISSATDCATAAGSYTVWMIDSATGRESTRAQEVVTASAGCAQALSLLASPQSGPLGTAFSYTGSGFTRSGTATLSITRGDGQPGNGGKYNTDATGNVSFVVTALSNDPAGTWSMRLTDDATGRQTSATVQYTSTQQSGTDVMYYTASSVDATLPDNTQLAPGETRPKVWRIQNAGTNTWSNYRLVFVPGTVKGNQSVNLSGTTSVTVNAAPGQWVNTPDLPVTAPPSSGTFYSYWQMQNGAGVAFGARIYVKIRVVAPQGKSLSYGSRGGQLGTGDSPKSKSAYNADPVNTATGNYNYESSDLRMAGRGLGLEFGRAYNSLDATGGPLGRGWSHSFNIYLTDTGGATPSVHYSDGKVLAYVNQYGTGEYQPSYQGHYDRLVKNADNTWTLTKTDQRVYQFGANGRLNSVQDRSGNRIGLAYSGGNLSQVTDASGRSLNLAYSGSLLTSVTDPLGRTLQFGYDASSNLASFRDANSNLNSYFYDAAGRLTRAVDGRGNNLLVNTYDAAGRVATQTNGRGYTWAFAYNADSSTSVFDPNNPASDPASKSFRYTQDTNFNIQRTADRLGNSADVRYDDRNNRSQTSDLQSNYFSYQYDAAGNVTAHTDPLQNTRLAVYDAKNNPTQLTDELGARTQLSYDAAGNLTGVTDALGLPAGATYNAAGQPLTTTDANGNATTRTYDAAGNLASVRDALNNTTTYAYDAVGRRTSATDARGKTTAYAYDANDNLLSVTDPAGGVTTYTYDANDNRTSVRDTRGNTTRYEYDQNNLLVKETDAAGNFVQHTYDRLDRRVSTRDRRGNITTFGYDDEGRLVSVTDPLGQVTRYAYDANGNRTEVRDPRGKTTTFAYDALNRVTKIEDPLLKTVRREYDAAGRLVKETDPRGNVTRLGYDPVGNLKSVTDSSGGTARYSYDNNRNRTSQADPNNNAWAFTYDKAGRPLTRRNPLGHTHSFAYDEVGNLASRTDAKGQTVRYAYDANNHLSSITYPDASTVRFAYDAAGNVTQMFDRLGTSVYAYDQLNRLTGYTDVYGKTLGYQYDPNGNLTALTYPDGKQVTYQYDAANRMTSLTDWAGKMTAYAYDAAGLLTRVGYPNGTTSTLTYDDAGMLTGKADAPSISSYVLTLDANGNRTGAQTQQPLVNKAVAAAADYTYDAANRILTAGPDAYTFDANGNMSSRTRGGVTAGLIYDFDDRLVEFQASASQYYYNGSGVRVQSQGLRSTTRYVVDVAVDLPRVLCETDGGGAVTGYYVYGQGLAYKVLPDGTHFYYHFDPTGSTVAMTGDDLAVRNAYAYDPFGRVTESVEATPNPFRFVGQYGVMDDGNTLLFMRARYYMPGIGRFINQDPVLGSPSDTQSLNLYPYVNSDPVNKIDPSGLIEYKGKLYRFSEALEGAIRDVPYFVACAGTGGRVDKQICYRAGYDDVGIGVLQDASKYSATVIIGPGAGYVLEGIDTVRDAMDLAYVAMRIYRGELTFEEGVTALSDASIDLLSKQLDSKYFPSSTVKEVARKLIAAVAERQRNKGATLPANRGGSTNRSRKSK
ncbi:MAG TPA: RHS repeat-associated core domain-containing protein [Pyrinomonadaceae bacterium]